MFLQNEIHSCSRCPRLRSHCKTIAQTKRRSYIDEEYWGKPVCGFGDPQARLMIVGLAPGAHGANRTGRMFTGDRSGEWLYRALHRFGFSNQTESIDHNDGLQLKDSYITCVVKCAPPDNQPAREEQKNCSYFLQQEIQSMPQVRVWIALGQFALNGLWPFLNASNPSKPKFKHGEEIDLGFNRSLLLSYHPSQQNTFTGVLTEPMFHSIFERARNLLL